ncbi:MAG TPA: hypothetical protein VFD06_11685 [Candidatus Polarisedimenticolia bacterium]|nr:hypothetical protein [Candidatus Polarisedimenticolia bacterium]
METRGAADYRIEPEFLGPLGDRPLAEAAGKSSPDDLFPGASKFLSARVQRKRREQWNAVRPLVKRLLAPGEHILYVAYAQQVPGWLDHVGLKHWIYAYSQVILVVTDQRIIEALLNFRANGPGTRLRSFTYRSLRDLKLKFGKLTAKPANGKPHAWRALSGGDRKLLGLLLPRLLPRLLPEGTGHAEAAPQWHCPKCGAAVAPDPEACAGCRTLFRSTRFAVMLSLAFPGGGLFYLGHPFLATLAMLGEAMIYFLGLTLLLRAPASEGPVAALVTGAFMLAMMKLVMANVVRVLGRRSIPEPEGRRVRAGRLAVAGGALLMLLTAGAFPLAAAARPRLDHDLDVTAADGSWHGSRSRSEWKAFKDDSDARSQWTDDRTGAMVAVFAYPRSVLDSTSEFRRQYMGAMKAQTARTLYEDTDVPAPFQGFRHASGIRTKDGGEVALMSWFLEDAEAHDLHEVRIVVGIDEVEAGEALVEDFLSQAKFVDAVAPKP